MTENKENEVKERRGLNFIEQIVDNELKAGKNKGRMQPRFPP